MDSKLMGVLYCAIQLILACVAFAADNIIIAVLAIVASAILYGGVLVAAVRVGNAMIERNGVAVSPASIIAYVALSAVFALPGPSFVIVVVAYFSKAK